MGRRGRERGRRQDRRRDSGRDRGQGTGSRWKRREEIKGEAGTGKEGRKERENTRRGRRRRRGGGGRLLRVGTPEARVGRPGRGSGCERGGGRAGHGGVAGTPEGPPLGAAGDLRRGQPGKGRSATPQAPPAALRGLRRAGARGPFVSAPGVRSRVCGGGDVCAPGGARVCASVSARAGGSAR